MKKDNKQLLQQYAEFLQNLPCEATEADYNRFNQQKQLLERLSEVENSALTVYDMQLKTYTFIRSKFDMEMGYDVNSAYRQGPSYFFDLMPENDIAFVINTTMNGLDFIHHLPGNEKKDHKLVFEYRLINPAGIYYRFIQQCSVLELDEQGNIWLVLIINDLLPEKSAHNQLQRKILNMKTGEISYAFDEAEFTSNAPLTQRETEILGLLSRGLMSKEISEKLFISVNTVNNHRQKIIEKMNVESTNEALLYAKKIGMI